MPIPTYEDRNPFASTNGYAFTNEEPEVFHRMLKGQYFPKAGAICSGGEIPLAVLTPHCGEVWAVDHSYMALASAMLKAMIIDRMGPRSFLQMLRDNKAQDFTEMVTTTVPDLPGTLKDKAYISTSQFGQMRKEWCPVLLGDDGLPEQLISLDKVRMIHGDLLDLKADGPFDLLYISNAWDGSHRGRNGHTAISSCLGLLNDGGLLLSTGTQPAIPGTELAQSFVGLRTGWTHNVHRKLPQPVATLTTSTP